ncbi:uncharacterized protein LOC110181690 [Drosophila serrata]|uniref:uncharacterized protein LOC110181690 n=1 Tax=Drosophila serrata TaxID=7274 RepID=UPI000A1CF3D7|nr:uncharacterized protein LOC110181690 [Drosophila serrata]KAH8385239.1 hypothetical protein KR200_011614 [Drosophila serrata]
MSYLSLMGLLVFLTVSVWSQDTKPVRDNSSSSVPVHKDLVETIPSGILHNKTNAIVHSNDHKVDLQKPFFLKWYPGTNSQKRIKLTPFERRVVRVLRKLGLLNEYNTAEKVVEQLRKDKDLLRKLKKLLDEVDEEDESDDFFTAFWDLFH